MKHGFIKVAAATPRVTVADCKANGEEILKAIHEMEKEHVKLMVFPEFCITGYTCHDLFLQRCLLDSAWDELLHIADETKETDALIFVGLPLRHRGKLYNVAAALNHGRIVGFVPKTHIPNYNEFYEQRQFAGAEEEDVEFVDFLKGVKNEEDEFWDEIPFGTELIFVRNFRNSPLQQSFVRISGSLRRQVSVMPSTVPILSSIFLPAMRW